MVRKHNYGDRPAPNVERAVSAVAARFSLDPSGDDARSVVARAIAEELAGASGAADDDEDLEAQARKLGYVPPEARGYVPRAVVTREPRTYSRESDPEGTQFIRDFVGQAVFARGDMGAAERLKRHMAEEQVERGKWLKRAGSGTSNFSGLVIPEYLVDLAAPAVQPLRPFADIAAHHLLGETGMTINISAITTADTAALQTSENVMPGTTGSPNSTMITEPVQTITGNVQLSRQLYERGTGIDGIVCNDLMRAYASALDSQMINQASTGAIALAAASTQTYTTASPTPATLWPWIAGAASAVETSLKGYASPDTVVCTPQRLWWIASGLGSVSLVNTVTPAPQWSDGVMKPESQFMKGPRYALPGGLILVGDQSIPANTGGSSNQDTVLVCASQEMHLFELPTQPLFVRANQVQANQLGITITCYGYVAFCLRRQPGALASVTGTGLVPAVF